MIGAVWLLALTRGDAASYLNTLFAIYSLLIIIRILLSWVPNIPYNRILSVVIAFVYDVTDPYLNLFRRLIPPLSIGPGAIDISPMLALILLAVLQRIVVGAVGG